MVDQSIDGHRVAVVSASNQSRFKEVQTYKIEDCYTSHNSTLSRRIILD